MKAENYGKDRLRRYFECTVRFFSSLENIELNTELAHMLRDVAQMQNANSRTNIFCFNAEFS